MMSPAGIPSCLEKLNFFLWSFNFIWFGLYKTVYSSPSSQDAKESVGPLVDILKWVFVSLGCYGQILDQTLSLAYIPPLCNSQNPPLEDSSSNPLLRQGHLDPVFQMTFEYLQGWRLPSAPGQPVPALHPPHRKEEFPDVQRDPPVFPCVPVASGSATGHHWREPGSVFTPSHGDLHW